MKTTILALAIASTFTSAAPAQSVGEKTGVNSVFGITLKTEDFIKEAAMSDMLEVDAAKIAQQKGDADEKKFAEAMITDHDKTSTELKGLVPSDMASATQTVQQAYEAFGRGDLPAIAALRRLRGLYSMFAAFRQSPCTYVETGMPS